MLKSKDFFAICITFMLLIVLFSHNKPSYAISLNSPQLIKFAPVSNESSALKIEFNGNNIGTDYSFEILNITNQKINSISGSSKYFVLQNLENNKEYQIIMRTCKNSTYVCTPWTNVMKAVTTKVSNIETTINNNKTTTSKTTKTPTPAPSCSLTYDSKNDNLSFKQTKNSTKYSIVKSGTSPSYSSKKTKYKPGADRMNKKTANVNIKYIGYVKNKDGKVGNCSLTVKVSRGAAAAAYAKKFVGIKYVHHKYWNGEKPLRGTDCSGFTGGIYNHFGKNISRDDDVQCASSYSKTYKVSGKNSTKGAKAGDIVCYKKGSDNIHVSMFIGDGKIIEMTSLGKGKSRIVKMSKRSWYKIVRVK